MEQAKACQQMIMFEKNAQEVDVKTQYKEILNEFNRKMRFGQIITENSPAIINI